MWLKRLLAKLFSFCACHYRVSVVQGRVRRKLFSLVILFVFFIMQYGAAQAQSGWYHCDIQIGPSTYACRPVSYDWLCNTARITSFCHTSPARGNNSDDGDNGSGVSVLRRSTSSSYSSMNVQRIGAAGIGVQWIINAGFIDAIDVWGDDVQGEVCLEGVGSLLFLNASTSPRAQSWLDSYQRDGRTCAVLAGPGTVVLMPAAAQSLQCRITTTGNLKLRAGPSLDDIIIGYVPRGATPNVISRDGDWLNVEYQGEAGWIGARYVGDSGDCGGPVDLAPAAAREGDSLICTTGNLRVRAGPSIDDDIIGYVRRGTTLRLISRSGDWIEIEYRGEAGWIGARYVGDCGGMVDLTSMAAREGGGPICTTGNLRVRAGPSIDDDIIGYVPRGVTLRSISRNRYWVNVGYQGEVGWIGAAYVSADGDCG